MVKTINIDSELKGLGKHLNKCNDSISNCENKLEGYNLDF